MNRIKRLIVPAVLMILTVVLFMAPGTALAYLATGSNTVRNSFRVDYVPPEPTSVQINVQKTVVCKGPEKIGPAGFSFLLKETKSGRAYTMISDEKGRAFLRLPFTEADIGKTYTYELSEINDSRGGVTYDGRTYAIAITLAVCPDNRMTAQLTLNGEAAAEINAAFENRFAPAKLPTTGDSSSLTLYALMLLLSGAGLALLMRKGSRKADRRPQ
ncbi:MAG: LPXTG cell wall anchor domain-containing protein [Clostridia bacterium]|nr:LPXTG cell wall anchor domain-containing protein [Clostridia bacterium]